MPVPLITGGFSPIVLPARLGSLLSPVLTAVLVPVPVAPLLTEGGALVPVTVGGRGNGAGTGDTFPDDGLFPVEALDVEQAPRALGDPWFETPPVPVL